MIKKAYEDDGISSTNKICLKNYLFIFIYQTLKRN